MNVKDFDDSEPLVYAFKDHVPVIGRGTFVHPSAVLIGDVTIGRHCYIGPGASLRGDFGRVGVGDGANVQDNCVLHCFPERDVIVEENAHIGHGAVLHGCRIQKNCYVGMLTVVMDDVDVGEESVVGANSFLPKGIVFPSRSMIIGSPAKVTRPLSDEEIARHKEGTKTYQRLAADSLATMKPTSAVRE